MRSVNFMKVPEIAVYSSWDPCETVNITQTSLPPLHHPTWKGMVTRVPIAPIGRLIENTSLNQDQIKTNHMEKFPHLLWRNKHLQRRPNHPNVENLDTGTSPPVPVELIKTMVVYVYWGSKDTYHLCRALKKCTCLFCNSGALDNRTQERCCHTTGVLLVEGHILDIQHHINIISRTEHTHNISYLPPFT